MRHGSSRPLSKNSIDISPPRILHEFTNQHAKRPPMKVLCLAYGDEDGWNTRSEEEQRESLAQVAVIQERGNFMAAVQTRGHLCTKVGWKSRSQRRALRATRAAACRVRGDRSRERGRSHRARIEHALRSGTRRNRDSTILDCGRRRLCGGLPRTSSEERATDRLTQSWCGSSPVT